VQSQFGSYQRLGGLGRCPGVRVMYGSFGGATVHGDAAYSAQMCSLYLSSSVSILSFFSSRTPFSVGFISKM